MKQRDRNTRTGAADGMAQGDCASVDVETVAIEVQYAIARDDLGSEGFVEFDEPKFVQAEIVLVRQFLQRRYWADAHGARIDACRRDGNDASERLQIVLLHEMLAGNDHGRGT